MLELNDTNPTMPNTLILQELKRLILVKMGIRVISPSDCRIISMSIQKELKRNISETTIKRLFGFAEIKHEFSKFTINTLKEYVGLVNDIIINPVNLQTTTHEDIDLLNQKAEKITNLTLQNIRNRCSVPYEMTISREFAIHDLKSFHDSKYSFTAFISQPGYGKSILLSHLIQNLFNDPDAPFKKDTVLFFSADHIFNKDLEDLSLEEKIKLKLGLHQSINLISYFNDQYQQNGIKLILVIDGFSDIAINKTLKPIIFDNLINFIADIENHQSIKLVLSMRSTTWSRFYEKIRHSYFFKSKWFSGSYFNLNDNSNVPPLTEDEVEKIFQKMSPIAFTKISDTLKAQLKFPFHIQWYYQLREEYPEFESYTNIIYYEIIARFIQEKIYNSTYATEKVLFCKRLIQLTNYGRIGYTVTKTDLLKEMPFFKNAYDELLSDGILMEEKHLKDGISSEFVRFIQPHIFEYFLFTELYELFNHNMDEKFFELINIEYNSNQVRFQLLQWSVRLMVKLYKFTDMEAVLKLNLNTYEKNYLIYFIAENLNYQHKNDPDLIGEIKSQKLHALLIRNLIHFDFLDSFYKDAINCLIEVVDTESTSLFYNTILAILDCLSLDQERILERMEIMEGLVNARKSWTVDPYEIVKLIYLKIKGIALSHDETLQQIENFKNNEGILNHGDDVLPGTKETINYLLILMVNLFYGSPKEATKIISAIMTQYPKLKKTRKFFSIYLLNILAQANARINPGDKTDQMEEILTSVFADNEKSNLTLYVQSILLSLKAEQSNNRKEYAMALKYAEECLAIYKRNNLAINALYTYKLIINIYKAMGNETKATEYLAHKNDLMTIKNVNLSIFN